MAKDVKSILRNLIRMYKLQSRENGTPRKRPTTKRPTTEQRTAKAR